MVRPLSTAVSIPTHRLPPVAESFSPVFPGRPPAGRCLPLLENPLHRGPHGIPVHRLGEEMDARFLRDCQTP